MPTSHNLLADPGFNELHSGPWFVHPTTYGARVSDADRWGPLSYSRRWDATKWWLGPGRLDLVWPNHADGGAGAFSQPISLPAKVGDKLEFEASAQIALGSPYSYATVTLVDCNKWDADDRASPIPPYWERGLPYPPPVGWTDVLGGDPWTPVIFEKFDYLNPDHYIWFNHPPGDPDNPYYPAQSWLSEATRWKKTASWVVSNASSVRDGRVSVALCFGAVKFAAISFTMIEVESASLRLILPDHLDLRTRR